MKRREFNETPEWTFWVPDSIADWDAPSHWERERLASMQRHLNLGDVLYDIGVEHGWLSALYGSWCGHENMVLVEPSDEFWPNIRLTWQHNGFPGPIACFAAFAGAVMDGDPSGQVWPDAADGPETGAMAYRVMGRHAGIPTITIDEIARRTRPPDAITIDIEGAELLALRGALEVLTTHTPKLWISVHPDLMERDFDMTDAALYRFLDYVGYRHKIIHIDHETHVYAVPR